MANPLDGYIQAGLWKCPKSPTGAHHWVEQERLVSEGLFQCKYCLETRMFPTSYEEARPRGVVAICL